MPFRRTIGYFNDALPKVNKVARSKSAVLIVGETGVGKDVVAAEIHRHLGVFEQANHGTVFLDEVTEMKLELQAKLLRVLEDHHVTRLGGRDRRAGRSGPPRDRERR